MADEASSEAPSATALPAATLRYLEAAAAASFRREEDSDEAVWRSFPFFAAALGLSLTMLAHLGNEVPRWTGHGYPAAANLLFLASALSFAWAFCWFWLVVKTRAYQYPAPDVAVQAYARQLIDFHRAAGLHADALDEAVLADLRAFAMTELGEAAQVNRLNNRRKLAARSQAMQFTLLGFALAFACGALIFLAQMFSAQDARFGAGHAATPQDAAKAADSAGRSPLPPAAALRGRGSEAIQAKDNPENMDRQGAMTGSPKAPPPASSKPAPPPPEVLKKTGETPAKRS